MIFHELISSGSQGGGELREAVTSSLSQREPSGVLVMPFFFLISREALLYKNFIELYIYGLCTSVYS